jgi:hypothetical protein
MKTIFKSLIIATAIAFSSFTPKSAVAQDQPVASLQTFYDQLAPYGQWVNFPNYGYVFIPNAGPGFIPYSTAGHWAYTEQFGWTWVSDYPWGWAAFHYGRWNYDYNYGWFWIPDLQWGPAWVVWRNSDQYYGWAPLPYGVDLGMGMNTGYGIPADHWCFVPNQYICDPYVSRYYLSRTNNDIFLMHTAIIMRMNYDGGRRYNYFAGPDRYEVERYHHGAIQPVVITYNSDPHHVYNNNEVGMYRPDYGRHDDGHHDEHHDDGHRDDGHHDDHHDAPNRYVQQNEVPQRDADHRHDNALQGRDDHQDNRIHNNDHR